MEQQQLKRILEGALLAAGQPLEIKQLADLFEGDDVPDTIELQDALLDIQRDCEGRGYTLKRVASGYRFQVVDDMAPWVGRLWEEKPQRYSRAMLETLALIAYRQPITRGDIEDIRGVAVSSHIIKTLQEREWVRVVGHKDVPGRPAMYATTRKFLDYFNLSNLDELPSLAEIADLDSLNGELELGDEGLLPTATAANTDQAATDSDIDADTETETETEAGDGDEDNRDHTIDADLDDDPDGSPYLEQGHNL